MKTFIDLKETYGSQFKVTLDPSAERVGQTRDDRAWLQQIPGNHGHIYIHGQNLLGAYCGSPVVANRLAELPGVTVHQRGDREIAVTFKPRELPAVAALLQCRRRRQVSEATKERLRALARARGESTQEVYHGAA